MLKAIVTTAYTCSDMAYPFFNIRTDFLPLTVQSLIATVPRCDINLFMA